MPVNAEFPQSLPCKIAFVAEAPGEEEVYQGKPLCGPSGKVFNQLLRTAGIDRAQCLVTNVFDEKAEGNDVEPWIRDGTRWSEATIRLQGELARAAPTVIVPLGDTALFALMGYRGIMSSRGACVAARQLSPGTKLVPTLHPAHVLRSYKHFGVVVGDLEKALREADDAKVNRPTRRLILEPTLGTLTRIEPLVYAADLLSVDIETGWGQITDVGLAWTVEDAVCIPIWDLSQPSRSYWRSLDEEIKVWQWIKRLMESSVPKLGQNFGGYDAVWFLQKMGIAVRNFREDTRLQHHSLYPEMEKSLEFMGAAYGTQGPWKRARKNRGVEVEKSDD